MRSNSHYLLLALLAGCFEAAVADSDRDGLLDEDDNCPTVPNPDQSDFDLDGIGDRCSECAAPSGVDYDRDELDDACDGCVGVANGEDVGNNGVDDGCESACPEATGIDVDGDRIPDECDTCLEVAFHRGLHDEDADEVEDACDVCPAVADRLQLLGGDSDFVGDACDPDSNALQVPRLFDAFVAFDGSSWVPTSAVVEADELFIPSPGSIHEATVIVGHEFVFQTRARLVGVSTPARLAVGATARQPPPCSGLGCSSRAVTCSVDNTGIMTLDVVDILPNRAVSDRAPTVVGDPTKPFTLRLRGELVVAGMEDATRYSCEATDSDGVTTRVTGPDLPRALFLPWNVQLEMTEQTITPDAGAAFEYAWLLAG